MNAGKKSLWVAAALLALTLNAAQARSVVPLIEPARVAVTAPDGKPVGAETMKAAIVRGGLMRKWSVKEERPGVVTLQFSKEGRHEVVVAVSYDDSGFQIKYVSSIGMKYKSQGAGAGEIHPFYNTWVNNLSGDIESAAHGLAR